MGWFSVGYEVCCFFACRCVPLCVTVCRQGAGAGDMRVGAGTGEGGGVKRVGLVCGNDKKSVFLQGLHFGSGMCKWLNIC